MKTTSLFASLFIAAITTAGCYSQDSDDFTQQLEGNGSTIVVDAAALAALPHGEVYTITLDDPSVLYIVDYPGGNLDFTRIELAVDGEVIPMVDWLDEQRANGHDLVNGTQDDRFLLSLDPYALGLAANEVEILIHLGQYVVRDRCSVCQVSPNTHYYSYVIK